MPDIDSGDTVGCGWTALLLVIFLALLIARFA